MTPDAGRPATTVLKPPLMGAAAEQVRRALADGAVMAYPTETAYALGGNALHRDTVAAVYALKGRPAEKALLLLVDGSAGVERWTRGVGPAARALMAAFWPGPLTLVFEGSADLPRHLPDARGTVALRWSPHPLVAELLRLGGGAPLIGTSANRSGRPALHSLDDLLGEIPHGIEVAIDGGGTAGGAPSTVVDTTIDPPRVLRAGAVSGSALRAVVPEIQSP